MHETLEEQGGETAYSETTALLRGREIFCSALPCYWSQETAQGRENNCTW